jgi:lipopolysaccharide transport system ATP-binding protein
MKSGEKAEVRFTMDSHIAPGIYFLNCGVKEVAQDTDEFLHRHVDAAIIRITSRMPSTVARGLVDLGARLSISRKMVVDIATSELR